jgi:hypothetical protein
VRLTKISDDDCDIHIQLGADPAKHFPQVIAEIPPGSKTLRKEFAQALGANVTKSTKFFDGPQAVKITVTGFAFFDASHVCADHPNEGCAHGRGVNNIVGGASRALRHASQLRLRTAACGPRSFNSPTPYHFCGEEP